MRERAKEMGVLNAIDYGLWLTRELMSPKPAPIQSIRTFALSRLTPPLTLLTNPEEPTAWRRPFIDLLLHDALSSGLTRASKRAVKVLEDKYGLKFPDWALLGKN